MLHLPKVTSQFNSNYRSGIEVLEDEAVEEFLTFLPKEWGVDIRDVEILDYQLKDKEREAENED